MDQGVAEALERTLKHLYCVPLSDRSNQSGVNASVDGIGIPMIRNARGYTGGVLVARSIGFGFLGGSALGVAGLMVLLWYPWEVNSAWELLGDALLLSPYAAVIGSLMGAFVGLCCGVALVVAGPTATGDRLTARRIAGVAAATPFVVLAAIASENDAQAWELGGWMWWLFVAAMGASTGAAIGPHVVGGRADPLRPGHFLFRHCRLTRSVRPI
jgi:hypothetical protein